MRGFSLPNGSIISSETNGWSAKAAERLPYDPQAAKKLLAEAGYPNGFEFTLDCPNNRYINDEAIGKALAGMWAKIGVKVKVNAIPRANYFPKVLRYDSSVGMVGWVLLLRMLYSRFSLSSKQWTLKKAMASRISAEFQILSWML